MNELLTFLSNKFILVVLCATLLIVMMFSRIKKKDKILLVLIVLATLSLAIFEYIETLFNESHIQTMNFPRYLFSYLCYVIRPIIIVLFFHIRIKFRYKRYYLIWIGVIVNTIIYTISLLSYFNPEMRFVVWYSDTNIFSRSMLGFSVYVICAIYLISFIIISIVETHIHKTRRQIDFIIIFTTILAIISQVIIIILKLDSSNTSEIFVIGASLYYLYLAYDKGQTDAVKKERELQAKTTALMLSQIQPHFIYNTLTTIQVLCELDPEKAASTISDFSKYLRMHTDALSKTEPIPVIDEIKHAMAYSQIEMTRFDNIKVMYVIKDKDFKMPVLSIQPMIENAIKYGVRAREHGLIEVITYKEGNNHILKIKDNGIGFNPERIEHDGKTHVGIDNVKSRIINMVGGKFEIESILDKGTTVTITIPEEQ